MPRKKNPTKPVTPLSASAFEQGWSSPRAPQDRPTAPPTVSGRWLLIAAGIAMAAAGLCAWGTLCLLFWQGSWQLLYHPTSAVARTPANFSLVFDAVAFATTEAGEPRLNGWWIPAVPDARYNRFTVLYLHGQTGNLGDSVDQLHALRELGLNIFAFDYRGYGQSQFVHPSEAGWREDADWALQYLSATRHLPANSIILEGNALGANLALEVAASHPELAGVVLESPLPSPVEAIFSDPRAHLVPAHLLVPDQFNAEHAANRLLIPSLWVVSPSASKEAENPAKHPAGYDSIRARKTLIWLNPGSASNQQFAENYTRWLDDLPTRIGKP